MQSCRSLWVANETSFILFQVITKMSPVLSVLTEVTIQLNVVFLLLKSQIALFFHIRVLDCPSQFQAIIKSFGAVVFIRYDSPDGKT